MQIFPVSHEMGQGFDPGVKHADQLLLVQRDPVAEHPFSFGGVRPVNVFLVNKIVIVLEILKYCQPLVA